MFSGLPNPVGMKTKKMLWEQSRRHGGVLMEFEQWQLLIIRTMGKHTVILPFLLLLLLSASVIGRPEEAFQCSRKCVGHTDWFQLQQRELRIIHQWEEKEVVVECIWLEPYWTDEVLTLWARAKDSPDGETWEQWHRGGALAGIWLEAANNLYFLIWKVHRGWWRRMR